MKRIVIGLVIVVGFTGMVACSESERPAPAAMGSVSDSAGIRLVDLPMPAPAPGRTLSIDETWMPDLEVEVGRLGDLAVLRDGRVVVLDELAAELLVVRTDGALEHRFGRLGEGPGEFSPHGGLSRLVATDSSVIVPDVQLQRLTEFSFDGGVLSERPIPSPDPAHGPVHGIEWRSHPQGGVVFRALVLSGDLLLWARGEVLDTLHVFRMPRPVPNRLLSPTPHWDMDPEGRLVLGRSDLGHTELRSPGEGTPEWIVRRGSGDAAVTPDDIRHLQDLLVTAAEARGAGALPADERERIFGSVSFPSSAPLLAAVLADTQGRYWVQRAAPIRAMDMEALRVGSSLGFGGPEWEVLDADGTLAEVVAMPRGFTPRHFEGDCLYGILKDDLDAETVARVCPDGWPS